MSAKTTDNLHEYYHRRDAINKWFHFTKLIRNTVKCLQSIGTYGWMSIMSLILLSIIVSVFVFKGINTIDHGVVPDNKAINTIGHGVPEKPSSCTYITETICCIKYGIQISYNHKCVDLAYCSVGDCTATDLTKTTSECGLFAEKDNDENDGGVLCYEVPKIKDFEPFAIYVVRIGIYKGKKN
eukprot:414634_1